MENSKKKVFGSIELYMKGQDFLGNSLFQGETFVTFWASWVPKYAETFVRRYQKYKLTFVAKCTYKKLIQNN
jgi:hypothetical protein